MPSSEYSSYSSSSYTSSSDSSSDGYSDHHVRFASPYESEWTVSHAQLNRHQPLAFRFMGYAAGRPKRATAVLKKVRDAPDNRSMLSISTAGTIFTYEPETKMYWVQGHRGSSSRSRSRSHGRSSRRDSSYAVPEGPIGATYGAMPMNPGMPMNSGIPMNPGMPMNPGIPLNTARPIHVSMRSAPTTTVSSPPTVLPTSPANTGVRVSGPPRGHRPVPNVAGLNIPVAVDMRRIARML